MTFLARICRVSDSRNRGWTPSSDASLSCGSRASATLRFLMVAKLSAGLSRWVALEDWRLIAMAKLDLG